MASLKDKVILITGSGDETGIGASTALYMIQFQPKLVLTGRDETRLQRVGELCKEAGLAGDRILLVVGDVAKDSDLERLVETTIQTFKQLDVLINNAGITFYHNIFETSMEEFDLVMNTNLRSPFYLTKLCLPHLIKTKGNIVSISSISGSRAYLERANLSHPLGHPGTVTDVAKAIVFLASDDSSFTTGHLLFVDGGRLIKPW